VYIWDGSGEQTFAELDGVATPPTGSVVCVNMWREKAAPFFAPKTGGEPAVKVGDWVHFNKLLIHRHSGSLECKSTGNSWLKRLDREHHAVKELAQRWQSRLIREQGAPHGRANSAAGSRVMRANEAELSSSFRAIDACPVPGYRFLVRARLQDYYPENMAQLMSAFCVSCGRSVPAPLGGGEYSRCDLCGERKVLWRAQMLLSLLDADGQLFEVLVHRDTVLSIDLYLSVSLSHLRWCAP
jgi:hypothetical protein